MENKKIGKKWIILTICIALIVIVAGIVFYIMKNKQEENPTTGTEWGDKYLECLNQIKESVEGDARRQGIKNDTEITMNFIQLTDSENPIMILSYPTYYEDRTIYNYMTKYIENDKLKELYETSLDNEKEYDYLYSIENDSYDWYKVDFYNMDKSYISISDCIEARKISEKTTDDPQLKDYNEYVKTHTSRISLTEEDNKKYNRKNFDDLFILIKQGIKELGYNFTLEMQLSEIAKVEQQAIESFISRDELITDEIKQKVADKKQEIIDKELVQKQAEEEAQKKAQEEAAKGFKVGEYTLKYGTYKGSGKLLNGDVNYTATFVLNSDGTYSYTRTTGNDTRSSAGTFFVKKDTLYGIDVTGPEGAFEGLGTKSSNGETGFYAVDDGTIWDMDIKMTYTGN